VSCKTQITDASVRAWCRRFAVGGIDCVGRIAPSRGRKSWLAEGAITADTLIRACLSVTRSSNLSRILG
jgi:hypothetical protein